METGHDAAATTAGLEATLDEIKRRKIKAEPNLQVAENVIDKDVQELWSEIQQAVEFSKNKVDKAEHILAACNDGSADWLFAKQDITRSEPLLKKVVSL